MGKTKGTSDNKSSTLSTVDIGSQPVSIAYFKATSKHPKVPSTSILKATKIFWPLSLFMRYHEKEDFTAMVDLAVGPNSNTPSENQEFILGDGPQAYNFAIDKFDTDPESQELRDAADRAGDEWLKVNDQAVARIRARNVKFSRWREILADPDYQQKRKQVFDCYYSTNTDFITQRVQAAMEQTAFMVLDRFKARDKINDIGRGRLMAVRFVLEECALFAHMALKYGFHFIAYPSDCPAAVEVTKEVFVDSDPRGRGKNLLQWLRVGFRHPKPVRAPEPEQTPPILKPELVANLIPDSPPLHGQNGASSHTTDNRRHSDDQFPGSSSSSDDEAELPPELRTYQMLIIRQIDTFTRTLVETGQLNQESSGKLINSVARTLISGSPPNEGAKFPWSYPSPPSKGGEIPRF